jgi:hypothetical protein
LNSFHTKKITEEKNTYIKKKIWFFSRLFWTDLTNGISVSGSSYKGRSVIAKPAAEKERPTEAKVTSNEKRRRASTKYQSAIYLF